MLHPGTFAAESEVGMTAIKPDFFSIQYSLVIALFSLLDCHPSPNPFQQECHLQLDYSSDQDVRLLKESFELTRQL
jgi:hypothetical protein